MAQLFSNNAASLLVLDISAVDTAIAIRPQDADEFPAVSDPDFFKATLEDAEGNIEIIKVTSRAPGSSSFSVVERGQEGTTPIAFDAGSVVECRLTAADITTAIGHPTANPAHAASAISMEPIYSPPEYLRFDVANVQDGFQGIVDYLVAFGENPDLTQYVLRAGDTMTGDLTLFRDPTSPFHAATKQYVDTKVGSGGTTPPSGGNVFDTITVTGSATVGGQLLVSGNSALAQVSATKVDSSAFNHTGISFMPFRAAHATSFTSSGGASTVINLTNGGNFGPIMVLFQVMSTPRGGSTETTTLTVDEEIAGATTIYSEVIRNYYDSDISQWVLPTTMRMFFYAGGNSTMRFTVKGLPNGTGAGSYLAVVPVSPFGLT